ncbi:MAG: hypothetical protein ACXIT9_00990 [Nitritalea sp.]
MSKAHFSHLSTKEAETLTGGTAIHALMGGPIVASIIAQCFLEEIKEQAIQDLHDAVLVGPGHPGSLGTK